MGFAELAVARGGVVEMLRELGPHESNVGREGDGAGLLDAPLGRACSCASVAMVLARPTSPASRNASAAAGNSCDANHTLLLRAPIASTR